MGDSCLHTKPVEKEGFDITMNCCLRLCGTGDQLITCYLCLEDISTQVWHRDNHRTACASRNTAKMGCLVTHQSIKCFKCGSKMRIWSDQGPAFYCDSGLPCKNYNKKLSSIGGNRLNCFLCDFDLCRKCVTILEKNFEEKRDQKVNKDENMNHCKPSVDADETAFYFPAEEIPLIDSVEEHCDQLEEESSKLLMKPLSMFPSHQAIESPDIFQLRAPLVSCENLLTPALS